MTDPLFLSISTSFHPSFLPSTHHKPPSFFPLSLSLFSFLHSFVASFHSPSSFPSSLPFFTSTFLLSFLPSFPTSSHPSIHPFFLSPSLLHIASHLFYLPFFRSSFLLSSLPPSPQRPRPFPSFLTSLLPVFQDGAATDPSRPALITSDVSISSRQSPPTAAAVRGA